MEFAEESKDSVFMQLAETVDGNIAGAGGAGLVMLHIGISIGTFMHSLAFHCASVVRGAEGV